MIADNPELPSTTSFLANIRFSLLKMDVGGMRSATIISSKMKQDDVRNLPKHCPCLNLRISGSRGK